MSQNAHIAMHIAHKVLESDAGKAAVSTAASAVVPAVTSGISSVAAGVAAAGTAVVPVAVALAPFVALGAVGYGIYWLFKD